MNRAGRVWRAPGKLVLIGEYAVLDGAGAVVAAVDHGVTCTWTPGATRWITPGDDRFVAAALAGLDGQAGTFDFTDWNPVDLGGAKAGFGGSAAAAVAAVLAAGRAPADAFSVHHAVQGSGSGVDVFAALHGGVRRFPDGAPVRAPCLSVIWSGRSAQTGPRVQAYRAWPGRSAFVDASRALVEGYGAAPVPATREAWRLLRAMAADAGIAYSTPEHEAIVALAERFGGAAKPSGAGGGDIAVAVFPDEAARAGFEGYCRAGGLALIPCRVAPAAGMRALRGDAVDLLPCTPERLDRALRDRAAFAAELEATVPPSWPQPDYAALMRVQAERWSRAPDDSRWSWLVVDRGSRTLVGEVGATAGPDRSGELTIGYAIVPEHRRRGLARDAVTTFADWAADQPGVRALGADCLATNAASRAVLCTAGFTQVGSRREGAQDVMRWRRTLQR